MILNVLWIGKWDYKNSRIENEIWGIKAHFTYLIFIQSLLSYFLSIQIQLINLII